MILSSNTNKISMYLLVVALAKYLIHVKFNLQLFSFLRKKIQVKVYIISFKIHL